MFYQVSKIQLALNTPALYPCQRAIHLSTRYTPVNGVDIITGTRIPQKQGLGLAKQGSC